MGSDLKPMPYENGSYCRRKGDKLIVVVQNKGNEVTKTAVVAPDPNKGKTHTKVIFGPEAVYGPPEELETKLLAKDEKIELEFECPKEECFDPDCEFYIIVDSKKELTNEYQLDPQGNKILDNTHNNKVRGVCFDRVAKPDLVPEKFDDHSYFKRVGNTLKVKIKNQGTATAVASKTKIVIAGTPPIVVGEEITKELEPGQVDDTLVFDIPPAKHEGDFRIQITADSEGKVEELNEDNNVVTAQYVEASGGSFF